MKYVIYNLSGGYVFGNERYDTQEEALQAIRNLPGYNHGNLAVLLVGSSTHEEVNGL